MNHLNSVLIEGENAEIALTMVRQLGGARFRAMTSARFLRDESALVVKFKGSRKANSLRIELNRQDLYDITFYHFFDIVDEHTDVYADMLQSIFTDFTGLDTKL